MEMDKHFFELSSKDTLIEGIEDSPSNRKLGGEKSPQASDKIRLYIGTKPSIINIRDFIRSSGKEIPSDLELFKSYEIYVLSHSLGIIKEGGWEKVNQVGYRMEFNDNSNSVVLDLLPQPKYTKNLGGELKFDASLSLEGSIRPPLELNNLIDKIEWLSAGGKLQASTDSSFVGNISFSVYTTDIQAIGKNGDYSEWQFNKTEYPLHGSDIEMSQILLIDRFTDTIKYKCKAYVNITSWLGINSVRRETDWFEVNIKIK